MRFDYRIGIFGSVSSGKSTLVNCIFAKHLSQMNIRRTTMVPQVYKFESGNRDDDYDVNVFGRNKDVNEKFHQDNWDGKTVLEHNVEYPLNFLPNNANLIFSIYDLPGLNDQKTKNVYMKWAGENFHLFDCVILVIDIYSGLNTSDELDICKLIFNRMAEKRHVNLVVLVNKCDDMVCSDGDFFCEEDKEGIFKEQIIPTLDKLRYEYNIEQHRINIIKFCSRSAFIYRTIYHNSAEDIREHLDTKHLHEMMLAEFGRSKWLKLTEEERNKRIDAMIEEFHNDEEVYESNMKHTGFIKLRSTLSDIVNTPKLIRPFYEKTVMERVGKNITQEECLDVVKVVDKLVLVEEIKSQLVRKVVDFYVDHYFLNYNFGIKGGSRDVNNVKIGRWFVDLKNIQEFEDKINELGYVDKMNISKSFFEKLLDVFSDSIDLLSEDKLFCKIIDRRLMPSMDRYNKNLGDYIERLVESYIKPTHWNDMELFEWLHSVKFRVDRFIIGFITHNFVNATSENVFYLYRMSNQLRGRSENLSIYCDMKRLELQSRNNFRALSVSEMDSLKDYDEKYGKFLGYLLEKFRL